jgi:hypothetical protein
MGIPLGKIQLYVGGGGFHPEHSLPALIDNGTNTKSLVEDKFYFVRGPAPRARVAPCGAVGRADATLPERGPAACQAPATPHAGTILEREHARKLVRW